MKLKLFITTLVISICFFAADAQVYQADQIAAAQSELAEAGVDQDEVKRRLRAKGIDLDNIQPEQVGSLAEDIKSVIEEIKSEQNADESTESETSSASDAAPQSSPDAAPEGAVKENKESSKVSKTIEKTVLIETPKDSIKSAAEKRFKSLSKESADEVIRKMKNGATLDEAIYEVLTEEEQNAYAKQSSVYGMDVFFNKSLDVYRSTSSSTTPNSYVLDVGDKIAINIFGASQADLLYEIEEIWIRPVLIPLGIVLAGLTGYLDDRLDLRATIRLPLYALSVGLVLFASSPLSYMSILGVGMALIVLVGIINIYNFMDGINGITGLYSIVFFGSMLFYLNDCNPNLLGFTEVLLIPALCFYIVFGVFNYRKKAVAFLGDAGSIGTGLLVSTCLIFLFNEFQSIHVLSLLLVYGVDSVGTILIRLIRRENIFKAHRSHFYQDLVHKIGISHLVVSISYVGIQLIINMLYLSNYFSRTAIFVVSLVILIVTFVIGKMKMGTLKLNQLT